MWDLLLFIFSWIAFATGNGSPHGKEYISTLTVDELNSMSKEIAEDALLDVMGLIKKYEYPAESHQVQTEDGYLLTLHRIPGGKGDGDQKRIPVLVIHGLLSSSADYVINGPGKALAYILADEGYDVWLGNARGNYYSRKHITLDPDKGKFWRFSWHEIGKYDLPAMIDFILKMTGEKKLHYIGHSQGTTAFFVMGSERREYNEKIISMQALAPVAYMNGVKSPLLEQFSQIQNIQIILSLIGVNEILPNTNFTTNAGQYLCSDDSKYQWFCTNLLFALCGYSPDQLNTTMLPIYIAHTPAGASSRQLVHYSQLIGTRFRQYDHGTFVNMAKYGSPVPPRYRMKHVKAPIAFHFSVNDLMAQPMNVVMLANDVPNSLGLFRVPDDNFNHLDFMWAIDAKALLYDQVISIMKQTQT